VVGAALAFLVWQLAIWVYFLLELLEERLDPASSMS
jgi:hypothetical protein